MPLSYFRNIVTTIFSQSLEPINPPQSYSFNPKTKGFDENLQEERGKRQLNDGRWTMDA